jgi:putative iron-only hydrogenase system regulator
MILTSSPKRLGTLAILVADRERVDAVNSLISQHQQFVLSRIGFPYRERNISIIVLLVEATTDELGSFAGKLGSVPGIKIRSSVFDESTTM